MSRSLHGTASSSICSPTAHHRPIAGNLDAWPAITADTGNFVEFDYERRVNGVPETRRARGRLFALTGEFLSAGRAGCA